MQSEQSADAVIALLRDIGEDPTRAGLLDTPKRYVKAFHELTEGYKQDPADILSRVFDGENYDEMVVVRGIEFTSLCEHHLLPFVGEATVAYIPDGKVVGLSKIPRLVHCFAKRLQLQERLTKQIADAIMERLAPLGVGVIVRASHSCMRLRGVRCRGEMVTSTLLGNFREPAVRQEFLSLNVQQQ